jgi:hypothetical protein
VTPVRLREDGVLWLVNRSVFHPRGFALAVDESGDFYLVGDGSDPWIYADDVDEDALFEAVEDLFVRARAS